jgi:hypothetical protein
VLWNNGSNQKEREEKKIVNGAMTAMSEEELIVESLTVRVCTEGALDYYYY